MAASATLHAPAVKEPKVRKPKKTQFSYTRLDQYDECAYKYRLKYEEKNFISEMGVAAAVGTLVHYIEETIATHIIKGEAIDYDALKKLFYEIDIPEKTPEYDANGNKKKGSEGGIYGVKKLQEMYGDEFFELDDNGSSYYSKCVEYRDRLIYRLENHMKAHPELEIVAVEKEFFAEYKGHALHGYIDRVLYDKNAKEYVLEDIKTKGKPFPSKDLATPLQFVVYSYALTKMLGLLDYPVRFNYDLPFCDMRQAAGTKGVMTRGFKKLDKIFAGIEAKDFPPGPSPLCYWCEFSPTNPKQPEAGKGMCPYYSLWTKGGTRKAWETDRKWAGAEAHDAIMEQYRKECGEMTAPLQVAKDFGFDEPATDAPADPWGGFDF